jgi:DNA-binding helix-hairpin-helix protein with protein kinase domain
MSTPTTGHTVADRQGRRYTLGRLLGTGSQASVYQATGPSGRNLAVKLFKPSATLQDELTRVETLMHHVQRLGVQLPATVPLAIINAGQAHGYVTDLVWGDMLEALVSQGHTLPYMQGFQVVTAIWQALAQLHAHGIVHGDMHVKNVMLSPQGVTFIDMDNFMLTAMPHLPLPPMLGDVLVMAPELRQAMLDQQSGAHLISQASDVYATTAMTYLLLVGDDDNCGTSDVNELHKLRLSGRWHGDPLLRGQYTNLTPAMLPVKLMSLIRQGWQAHPALRPSAREFADTLQDIMNEGTLFVCPHLACGMPVFADTHVQHCPHCQGALPTPALCTPQGQRLAVRQGAMTVGRQELGGDPAISSKHAVLQRLGPMLRFTERSTFGASHRNRGQGWEAIAPSSAVVLQAGDKLRLGNTEFEVGYA